MLVILSPAKKLLNREYPKDLKFTSTRFDNKSIVINNVLKELNPNEVCSLMKISEKLRDEVFSYIHKFNTVDKEELFPCIFYFNGEAFKGLNIEGYSKKELEYANNHLRVLSGLYGVLRPLDKINKYRLEMGTKLKIKNANNLYEFWEDDIKETLIEDIKKTESDILVNLASEEYSKAAKVNEFKEIKVITPIFKEYKNGVYKVVTVHAKRARGIMASFIIKNKIKTIEEIKKIDLEGYVYREDMSTSKELVFTLG
ncbi:peroxide stress protein YaaA [uncultured Clostridium sp.]|uniref:peroxide stress protein YaaA n=1 Tax=uncultured Clostridium sp. TaxID=59620 RepID=UPI00260D4A39|nr:peroxide stress protein YaaA [uncultured Clostridium sp.]